MALSLARALLPLLAIAMVTRAAPLAEQTKSEKVAAAATGDSNSVDIAKRAKEVIVFGNQQNSARLGPAKRTRELSQDQPQPQESDPQQTSSSSSEGQQDRTNEPPEQPSSVAAAAAAADEAPEKAEQASSDEPGEGQAADAGDAGEPQGSDEELAVPEEQPSSEGVQEAQALSEDQSDSTDTENSNTNEAQLLKSGEGQPDEGEHEQEEEEEASQASQPVEGGEHPEQTGGEEEEQQMGNNLDLPLLSGLQEGGMHADPENTADEQAAAEVSPDDDDHRAVDTGDGQSLDTASQEDEVESLLTDLQNSNNVQPEGSGNGDAESKAAEEEQEEELEAEEQAAAGEDEGSAERELIQVASQMAGDTESSGDDSSNSRGGHYSQSLLNYILSHGDQYGHSLPYPADPYYLQRQRRSLAARSYFGLPHIHRGRSSRGGSNNINDDNNGGEKELSRAKRTKRDLFDDGLYYNAADNRVPYYNNNDDNNPLLERAQEEEEEMVQEESEEEKDAEVQELLAYLVALYPALYGDNSDLRANTLAQIPGYLWQGPTYPEAVDDSSDEEEGERPYWLEPSGYPEPRVGAWEEPELQQPAPAWEPSFYPEEVEEEEEEEVPELELAKRQMMSFVPGERRKRYFFPFAREPYTHWGAFVPTQKKRGDYYEEQEEQVPRQEKEDPYRRLRELALVLAEEDRQPSSSSYFDGLDVYQKK